MVKSRVRDKYGVELEEEVLFLGEWTDWESREGAA
jgi:UDP-N-acetylenolpyruvoylglucosamine reductase